jgi:hypothetical protein
MVRPGRLSEGRKTLPTMTLLVIGAADDFRDPQK